jgi:hypothetical protein
MPRYVTAAPYGLRMNVPNADYWQTTPETHIHFHINGEGMRDDHDYIIAKPAGTCRILMLGDSFFMGYEVSLEDSLQSRLEQTLHQNGFPCEVLNLAVSGMGPAESLITFDHTGKQYAPDIVLLEMHRTNLDNNVRSGLFAIEDGQLVQKHNSYLPGVKLSDELMQWSLYRWAIEHSQLYSAVRERLAALFKSIFVFMNTGQIDKPNGESLSDPWSPEVDAKRQLNLKIVQRLEQDAKPASLMLLEIPDYNGAQFSSYAPLPKDGNPYRTNGQYIDIRNELTAAAQKGEHLFYTQGESHMAPAGVAIAAHKTADILIHRPELQPYRQGATRRVRPTP